MGVVKVMVWGRGREWDEAVGAPREFIAAVPVHGLQNANNNPNEIGAEVDMLSQENVADWARDGSTHHEFYRVRVLGSEAYASRVLVVNLMNVRIDYSPVQEPMSQVEEKVLANHKKGDLKHHSLGIRQVLHRRVQLYFPVICD